MSQGRSRGQSRPKSGRSSGRGESGSESDEEESKSHHRKKVESPKADAKRALGLNIPKRVSPFESGPNTECIQLLRVLWNLHDDALQFTHRVRVVLGQLRKVLKTQFIDIIAGGGSPSTSPSARHKKGRAESGKTPQEDSAPFWVPLQPIVDGLGSICESIGEIERQFSAIVVFQTQCKLVLYSKVREAKRRVTHDHLVLLHGVSQLITTATQLLSSPTHWTADNDSEPTLFWISLLQLSQVYNECLESAWSSQSPSKGEPAPINSPSLVNLTCGPPPQDYSTTKDDGLRKRVKILQQVYAASRNDSPLLRLSLKPYPSTRFLQIIGIRRASLLAITFTRNLQSAKAPPSPTFDPSQFETLFGCEDNYLGPLASSLPSCPSVLGRGALRRSENGDQRLTKAARAKLYNYYHGLLWGFVGEVSQDLLLWGVSPIAVPLALESVEDIVNLKNMICLTKHTQGSSLSPLWGAFESLGSTFHSLSLLINWDEKMREGLETATRVKRPEHVALAPGKSLQLSDWATDIGSRFGGIVATSLSLVDDSDGVRSGVSEEEHLTDESVVLFRLEATLSYLRAWIVKRTKVWLNGWAIPQFLAVSQRDSALVVQLMRSHRSFYITRDLLLNNENLCIRLRAMHRAMCATDLTSSIQKLADSPEELLLSVGPICRTLATLGSSMPKASHWRRASSGLEPDRPSPYVKSFIARVVEPTTTSSVELLPGPVQEAMGRQVVNSACDAWLAFILQRKIKFSEWGAVQLLRDFVSFREWIRKDTELETEAKKSILGLEVLKKCEGVAYLLLRSPGDVLGVGKAAAKKGRGRRVAPSTGSRCSSPAVSEGGDGGGGDSMEDDIPPEMYVPNQQKWLELRLRRGLLASPCCH